MAQRIKVTLVDDIDGSEAAETVTFALDGVSYEIDLTDANATKLRGALAPWVGSARRAGRRSATTSGRRGARSSSREELAEIRNWARANGHKVSDRGRISQDVRDAYTKAH